MKFSYEFHAKETENNSEVYCCRNLSIPRSFMLRKLRITLKFIVK